MTTPDDVAAVLSRVAARGVSPVLSVRPETADEACALVLDAVRTCLLPRVVVVTSAGAPCLELEAVGGRLLSVTTVADRAGRTAFASLLGRSLTTEDAGQVAELFRASVTETGPLDITFRAAEASGNGISPVAVLEAMGLHWDLLGPAERLQHLDAATEEVLIGTRRQSGETRMVRKDAALPVTLVSALDECLRDGGLAARLADDEMLLLSHPAGADVTVALLHRGTGPEAMVFDPDVATDLAALWSELTRPALVQG